MFCSFFCNTKNEELAKPAAFVDIVDPQIDDITVGNSSSSSFVHLEHLNQPSKPLLNDDASISEEDLFEPVMEMEPSPSKMEPKAAEATTMAGQLESNHPAQSILSSIGISEDVPPVSKDDFVGVMQKIEKENAWYEKRRAKKVGGKKKSRRNNKYKKQNAVPPLQQRKMAGDSFAPASSGRRMPLATRNLVAAQAR